MLEDLNPRSTNRERRWSSGGEQDDKKAWTCESSFEPDFEACEFLYEMAVHLGEISVFGCFCK